MAAYRNQPPSQRLRTGRTLASLNPGTSDTSLHACNPYGLRGPPQTPCQPGGEVVNRWDRSRGCHPLFTGAGTPTPTSRPADGSLSITHALAKNWPSARRHGIAAGLCADLLRVLQMPPTMFRGAYHVVGLVVQ
jgi:hypothetical protein